MPVLWEQGEFGDQPPPPLEACNALGLPAVPSAYEPAATPAVRLKERLVDRR